MSRRRHQQPKKYIQPEVEAPAIESTLPSVSTKPSQAYWLVFAIGVLLYINTVPFDYALDDKLYITANEFTKKGLSGIEEIWTNDLMTGFFGAKKKLVEGGRYRPLALTTHAIEWQLFKENPHISHAINVLLYGAVGVLLLSVLLRVFPAKPSKWWLGLPFLATILYLAHPLHVEVAANIKSRDEIMSLLFALLAFRSVWKFLEDEKQSGILLSGLWFILSLFSKESTVTFLGVIPLTMVFFSGVSPKKGMQAMLGILAASGIYLAIRLTVFGEQGAVLEVTEELMNKPYMLATESQRLASIFFTMGLYIKLLFWPHPLTHDYYPFHPFRTYNELVAGAEPYVDWSEPFAVLSLAAYVAMLGFGLFALYKRISKGQSSVLGYSILLYLGTFILFSNLIFDIGAFMNDRFMFIPSLGFSIATAWVLSHVALPKLGENALSALMVVLMLAYSGMTLSRNYAWENDRALATADIGTSDGSAKVKMTMGSETLDLARKTKNQAEKEQLLKQAEQYELQALKIYPTYFPPLDILGSIYFEQENYAYSVHYFSQVVRIRRNDDRLLTNLEAVANVSAEKGDYTSADKAYQALTKYRKGPALSRIYSALGEMHGKQLNDLVTSKKYLLQAINADPSSASAYQKIGVVYAMTGRSDSALYHFNRSLELEPQNARVLLNLGILYSQMGDETKGREFMQRAVALDPSLQGGVGE